jgi:hypothetical protein
MNDAANYFVMVVLGTTIHEYPAQTIAGAEPFGGESCRSLTNSWMVGPSPTMTRRATALSAQGD